MELTEKMICALLRAYICENSWCVYGTAKALESRELVTLNDQRKSKLMILPEYKLIFTPKGLQLAQQMIELVAKEFEFYNQGA